MSKTALVIGATGLVGEQCLEVLLASNTYDKVIALTRRKCEHHNIKYENIIVDFDRIADIGSVVKADHVYCAMGTTIGKAGSREAFRKVDYEVPFLVAELALKNGAEKFILVSSMGADASSAIFYSKVKGQLEEALKGLGYSSLLIFRPSILLGNRRERRYGEEVGRFVAEKFPFLFAGPLRKYRGTPADLLASAMVKLASAPNHGVRIIENDEIFVLADK